MQTVLKFSFVFLLVACNNVTITHPEGDLAINGDTTKTSGPYTILLSGLPPPMFYHNAKEIIGKEYNVIFKQAAGCIVDERLGDSISTYNKNTFTLLEKKYNRNVENEIFSKIEEEADHLQQLDSTLKAASELKPYEFANNAYIKFKRVENKYEAVFILTECENGVMQNVPRLAARFDSQGKNIWLIQSKDTITNLFNELQ